MLSSQGGTRTTLQTQSLLMEIPWLSVTEAGLSDLMKGLGQGCISVPLQLCWWLPEPFVTSSF